MKAVLCLCTSITGADLYGTAAEHIISLRLKCDLMDEQKCGERSFENIPFSLGEMEMSDEV